MKKSLLLFIAILYASILFCQVPEWVNQSYRESNYPPSEWYTGFAFDNLVQGTNAATAIETVKRNAHSEMAESIIVTVKSTTNINTVSQQRRSSTEDFETITKDFHHAVELATMATTVKTELKAYHNPATGELFAFAAVKRSDLRDFYAAQINFDLNKVDAALRNADEFVKKGYKMKARKECENVEDAFINIFYAQNLLSAVDVRAGETTLQQNRSERLRNTLVQTLVDLENSIYIYIECNETIDGRQVVHIGD